MSCSMPENSNFSEITNDLCYLCEKKPSKWWWYGLTLSLIALVIGIIGTAWIFFKGLGVMDISNVIFWGILVTNFVFWIGVSHAGTFISAILLLLNQRWRSGISRAAETMTILSIFVAAIMPLIHLGRPGYFYWLFPISNRTGYFLINFYSPLTWDFYAILIYFIVSLIYFRIGLLPDLATLRDRSTTSFRWKFYNILALGWTGSVKQWYALNKTIFLLAGLITPLVISVHSIVSLDFAVTLNPGWHSTIFPLYFVTGAVFSGFAMVNVMAILLCKSKRLRPYIAGKSMENMNKIILFTGFLLMVFYLTEITLALYSANTAELLNLANKFTGHYGFISILVIVTTLILPQFLWSTSIRRSTKYTLWISISILAGMWLERFMIVVGSSESGQMMSVQGFHMPSLTSLSIIIGAAGLFFTLFFILIRFIPFVSIYEQKTPA
jgi:Ni/Fe-hydrogenase subunit HybB-like protein